ncbi:MAG: thermonuclease family protein [Sedimentisphaerales bacterium]|nr:thermonuclease family protein [Sedimentisphaerales bacterium]
MVRKRTSQYAISRRHKRQVLTIGLVCLLMLGILDHRFGGPVRIAISHWGPDWGDYRKYHGKTFHVVHVVDGDTFDIDIPDGKYPTTRVRLLGVDTPEKATEKTEAMVFGPEATQYTTDQILNHNVTVLIDTVGDVRGKYGRLLAYVVLSDGGILNECIIRHGYGYADMRFSHSHYERYLQIQEQAFSRKMGLWGEVSQEQLPRWFQREKPDFLK